MSDVQHMSIDGEWTRGDRNATFDVRDPATGEIVARVADAGPEDARRAVSSAHAALSAWSNAPPAERARLLHAAAAALRERRDALAATITSENGKPLAEARGEVDFAAGYLDWFGGEARRMDGAIIRANDAARRFLVVRRPVGVVAAITPWNFPATMITRKLAPALAAGCTVVLKPAEETPLTAIAIARVFHDIGLPKGVVNVVTTSSPAPIGAALLDDARVRKLAFTGSTEIGRQLAGAAAAGMKRLSLELGGNAPFIVFDDADLAAAIDAAVASKFLRVAGQSCVCANRFFVHERVVDPFVEGLVERVRALNIGRGTDQGVNVGTLISRAAVDRVDALVADAISGGARLSIGGGRITSSDFARGHFYAPTILTGVLDGQDVCRREIFGPVAPVMSFRTEREVTGRANATEYGLAGYVFTGDLARGLRVAEALECGFVGVNDARPYSHETPFGGFKESGIGREGGHEGMLEYTEQRTISLHVPESVD